MTPLRILYMLFVFLLGISAAPYINSADLSEVTDVPQFLEPSTVPINSSDTPNTDVSLSNDSDPADSLYPPVKIDIALGNQKQNVGDLYGLTMFAKAYRGLEFLCPENAQGCNEKNTWAQTVKVVRDGQVVEEKLLMKVARGYWGYNKQLRRLMIGTIAGALRKMTEDDKNCYDSGHGRFCNIGDFIGVSAMVTNFIDIKFISSQVEGTHFDCVAIIQETENYLRTLDSEYLEAFGMPSSFVKRNTHCLAIDVTKQGSDSVAA